MICGATAVLRQGYKNEYFWADIAKYECTVTFLLGAVANFLWQQPETDDDAKNSLERVGMVPLIAEYEGFAKRFGLQLTTGYASSESAMPTVIVAGDPMISSRCIGPVRDEYEVAIFDEHDRGLPVGEMGEICVRPAETWSLMQGYWKRPEATAKAFRNLWYHTGDAGYRGEDGCIYFVDRLTDSMRRRGENISSMEVEGDINQHPEVLECAVFPVWDENTEQEVMAVITPKPGSEIDPAELIRFLNRLMPYFMIPRYIEFTEALPKTPTGKIQKFSLRERGVTADTWDRVAAGVALER